MASTLQEQFRVFAIPDIYDQLVGACSDTRMPHGKFKQFSTRPYRPGVETDASIAVAIFATAVLASCYDETIPTSYNVNLGRVCPPYDGRFRAQTDLLGTLRRHGLDQVTVDVRVRRGCVYERECIVGTFDYLCATFSIPPANS